jgi:hypothetical protein
MHAPLGLKVTQPKQTCICVLWVENKVNKVNFTSLFQVILPIAIRHQNTKHGVGNEKNLFLCPFEHSRAARNGQIILLFVHAIAAPKWTTTAVRINFVHFQLHAFHQLFSDCSLLALLSSVDSSMALGCLYVSYI